MRKRLLLIGISMLLAAGAAFAAVRTSASYSVSIDAVTSGGGASQSASYKAPQQAIGQVAGFSQSASYKNNAGVVQPIPFQGDPKNGWIAF